MNSTILDSAHVAANPLLSPNVEYARAPYNLTDVHAVTEFDGVPDLSEAGYDCIRYMGTCNGGQIYLGRERKKLKDFVAVKAFCSEQVDDYTQIAKISKKNAAQRSTDVRCETSPMRL
uniref:Uncharacterized protein n=1 Tax=Caenorhabditis japonica TaxID=281687 RepID=A0A8R1I2D6_CAEJA